MTQERSSELLLTESGIQHRVPRRTLSAHPALQFPEVWNGRVDNEVGSISLPLAFARSGQPASLRRVDGFPVL